MSRINSYFVAFLIGLAAVAISRGVESSEQKPAEVPDMITEYEVLEEAVEERVAEVTPPRLVVFLPERIDTEWYWYYYADTSQHLVQNEVEKKLVRAGYDLVDLASASILDDGEDLKWVNSKKAAIHKAEKLGAEYMIVGTATASKMSHDVAYGMNVYRSQADITAKLVRVADGKILAVEDASATAGGQAQKTAGRDALKDAGKQIARALARSIERKVPIAE